MKNIIFLLLFGSSLQATAQDKTVHNSFGNIKKIWVSSIKGDITIKKSTGSNVSVSLTYSYDDKEFNIKMEQHESFLTLEGKFPDEDHMPDGTAHWILEVPDDVSINIVTLYGDITADNLKINLKGGSLYGTIALTDVTGKLDITCNNVEMENVGGDVNVHTGKQN